MIRAISAVGLGAIGIAAIWWLPQIPFDLLILAIVILGLVEYGRMFFDDAILSWSAMTFGAALAAAMLFCPLGADAAVTALPCAVFLLAGVTMWRARSLEGSAEKLALLVFAVVYLGMTLPVWSWLRRMDMGRELTLMAVVPASFCDIFGLLVGKTLGKRKLAPLVSPNKTVEGLAGALAGAIAGAFLVRWILLPGIEAGPVLSLAILIWIAAPLGDLIESMLKRSAGVKDSGHIIPGHGGILDRFDAFIFTGPAAYIFARYVLA